MLMLTATGRKNDTIALANDNLAKRLLIGLIVSIFANALLWAGASEAVRFTPRHVMTMVEVTRVIIDKQGHKQEKIVTKSRSKRRSPC